MPREGRDESWATIEFTFSSSGKLRLAHSQSSLRRAQCWCSPLALVFAGEALDENSRSNARKDMWRTRLEYSWDDVESDAHFSSLTERDEQSLRVQLLSFPTPHSPRGCLKCAAHTYVFVDTKSLAPLCRPVPECPILIQSRHKKGHYFTVKIRRHSTHNSHWRRSTRS